MDILQDLFIIEHLDQLIRRRSTGRPADLAQRLKTSERTIYRLIASLRDAGLPIKYDKERQTYFYDRPVRIHVEIRVGDDILFRNKGGGSKMINFFFILTGNGGIATEICKAFRPMRAGWGAGVSRKPC